MDQRASSAPDTTFWAMRSPRDWEHLLAHTQTLRYLPNETLLTTGSPNNSVYIVLDGRLESATDAWVEGQVAGIASFFHERAAQADVTATTDVRVARLTRDALDALAAREPELAHGVTMELARLLALGASL